MYVLRIIAGTCTKSYLLLILVFACGVYSSHSVLHLRRRKKCEQNQNDRSLSFFFCVFLFFPHKRARSGSSFCRSFFIREGRNTRPFFSANLFLPEGRRSIICGFFCRSFLFTEGRKMCTGIMALLLSIFFYLRGKKYLAFSADFFFVPEGRKIRLFLPIFAFQRRAESMIEIYCGYFSAFFFC